MSFTRFVVFPLLALAACSAASSTPPSQPPPAVRCAPEQFPEDVVTLVKKAPLVFRGTVVRAGATAGFTADPSTVVVMVDRLFADKPEDRYVGSDAEAQLLSNRDAILGGLTGEEVTLVAKAAPPPPGYRGYFFAESGSWGQSALLVEVARRDAPSLETVIPRLRKALLDAAVFDRMARADAVIVGEVTDVKPSATSLVVSEHDPLWTEASVRTTRTLKGSAQAVTVRFSASGDVCCFTRPKLAKGQDAIFILHRGEDGAYYVDVGDVLSLKDEERLRAVLACPPS